MLELNGPMVQFFNGFLTVSQRSTGEGKRAKQSKTTEHMYCTLLAIATEQNTFKVIIGFWTLLCHYIYKRWGISFDEVAML